MQRLLTLMAALALAGVLTGDALARQAPTCLHQPGETPANAARRTEALAAMRMIDHALYGTFSPVPAPKWESVASSPVVATLRGMAGPVGDLARKLRWGAKEPLPGWEFAFAPDPGGGFTLTDVTDPCRFELSSSDPAVVPPRGRFGILPLDPAE